MLTKSDSPGAPLRGSWALKVNEAWDGKKDWHELKPLYEKYNVPSNCAAINTPSMNSEMWRLLNKYQRQSELSFKGIQKDITKAATAILQLNRINMSKEHDKETRTESMQTTLDAMALLSHANHEVSIK